MYMRPIMLRDLMRVAFFLLAITQSACATLGGHLSGELSGVVIDKTTGEPIEGAIVVAQWEGSRLHPVDSVTECFHVETTTTDKDGKYFISAIVGAPLGIVGTQAYVSVVYKEGFREVSYKDKKDSGFMKAPRGVVHLIPFTGSREERMKYLMKLSPPCDGKSLLGLYRAVYKEGSRIAVTKEDKVQALHLLKDVEIIEIGSDNAWRKFEDRKRNLQ